MSDASKPDPVTSSGISAEPPKGRWRPLSDLLKSGPVAQTVHIIVGSDLTGFVTRLSGALFVAGNVYAKPVLIGFALLVIGGIAVGWAVKNHAWHGWTRVVSIAIAAIGLCFVIFHSWILRQQLEYLSSYDVKSLNSFPVGSKLDEKTVTKTTHGGIVAVTVMERDLSRKTAPAPIPITDKSGLYPDRDPQIKEAVLREVQDLTKVMPAQKSLTFLIAPGGMGKETILRQWVYALGSVEAGNPSFEHIFLLTYRDTKAFLDDPKQSSKGLQDALAFAYRGIVDSPEYFDLLLLNKPCLVVITNWDSIKNPDRLEFLMKIADLVANERYKTSVLIGTRPEALLRDFSIDDANTFTYERYLRFLYLQPLNERERACYFRRKELPILSPESYTQAENFINRDKNGKKIHACNKTGKQIIDTCDEGSKPIYTCDDTGRPIDPSEDLSIAGQLAQNLEFLNLIVEEIDEVQNIDSYTLCRRMTNRILRRSPDLAKDDSYDKALKAMHRLAYSASQNNTSDLEFAGRISQSDELILSESGLVDIENGSFIFASPVVHSYFALEGLRDQMPTPPNPPKNDWPPLYSRTLLNDVNKFLANQGNKDLPLPKELADVKIALACSLNQHRTQYDSKTKRLLLAGLRNIDPRSCPLQPRHSAVLRASSHH